MTHLHTINPNIIIVPHELYLDELFQTKEARKLTLQSKKTKQCYIEQIYSSQIKAELMNSNERKPQTAHRASEQHKTCDPRGQSAVIQSLACFNQVLAG